MHQTDAAGGVRIYEARRGFTPKSALRRTVSLAPGEKVVVEARIQCRAGRITVRGGYLILTDRRLFILAMHGWIYALAAGRVTEVPRALVEGVDAVMIDSRYMGGRRRAIVVRYEGQLEQDAAPFWSSSVKANLMLGAQAYASAGALMDKLTTDLYQALQSDLGPFWEPGGYSLSPTGWPDSAER
jgi:hypothetical protein